MYFYLPEIKNRTLEEIDEMFEARLPARQFRKYVCTGRLVTRSNEKMVERCSSGGSEKAEVTRQEVLGFGKSS